MLQIILHLLCIVAFTIAQDWAQIEGGAVIDISAKGNELWCTTSSQGIYRWVGNGWKQMPGGANRVGASPDGWSWVVNAGDAIFRWNVNSQAWDQIPGGLVQISAASKDRALGVNRGDAIFLWENNAWKQLPGAATWAAIGINDERWVINRGQQIFRWNHQRSDWDNIPGAAVNVDVQNANRVVVTNAGNVMYSWENGGWRELTGRCVKATVTQDAFYCANSGGSVYKSITPYPGGGAALAPAQACPKVECNCQCPKQRTEKDEKDVVVIYREEEVIRD